MTQGFNLTLAIAQLQKNRSGVATHGFGPAAQPAGRPPELEGKVWFTALLFREGIDGFDDHLARLQVGIGLELLFGSVDRPEL